MNTKAEETLIFLHIPRTAGTTLHRIIERQYPPTKLYSFDETHDLADFLSLSETRKAELCVVKGHMVFGVHEFLPGSSAYFTVLRDPVERTISNYHLARHTPQHHHHNLIKSEMMSLQDYLESEVDPMMDNGQTRMLCGGWHALPIGACTEEVLDVAKKNLREEFAIVGLTERFDETLLLLKDRFGWRNVFYVRQNILSGRPRKAELPPATRALVENYNELDAELYHYARMRFDEQVRQQGSSFARSVRSFQSTNRLLTWPVVVYWEIRKKPIREFVQKRIQR